MLKLNQGLTVVMEGVAVGGGNIFWKWGGKHFWGGVAEEFEACGVEIYLEVVWQNILGLRCHIFEGVA